MHPDLNYALVDVGENLFLLSEDLLESSLERYGIQDFKKLNKIYKGSELEGIMLGHPFYDKEVPIILGEHVTTEAGTGAVHTAPAHGQDDYIVGLKYNLPVDCPVDGRGCLSNQLRELAGNIFLMLTQQLLIYLRTKELS